MVRSDKQARQRLPTAWSSRGSCARSTIIASLEPTALSPQFTGTVSVLGILLGSATLIYTISKDHGIAAMRSRAVDIAKNRLTIWELKLRIQTVALTGDELEKAKIAASEVAESIHREANENLETLRVWAGQAPPIVGLPWWRKLFLLYRPIEGVKWIGYMSRFFYLLSWVTVVLYIGFVVWGAVLYFREGPTDRKSDKAYLVSKRGHGQQLSFGLSCLSVIWNGSMFYRSVRHERAPRRFKEIEKI